MERILWVIKTICIASGVCIIFDLTTSNVLPLMVACMYAALVQKECRLEKKEKIVVLFLSVFFTGALVYGNIESALKFDGIWCLVSFAFSSIGLFEIFRLILGWFFVGLRNENPACIEEVERKKKRWIVFVLTLVGLLLCWGIGLAFSYPGNFNRDGRWIIWQAIGNDKLSVANPILHTMIIRFLWNIGQTLFGTPNACVAVICTAQIVLIALIVAYMNMRLYERNVKTWICILIFLFYGIVPYNVQLIHGVWKDIPFTAFVMLFMVLLWEEVEFYSRGNDKLYILRQFMFVFAGLGMCIMRNNGYYAFLLFLPFGIAYFWKNKKLLVIELVLIAVLCHWIQGSVYDKIINDDWNEKMAMRGVEVAKKSDVTNATSTHAQVGPYILTLQQLARVVVDRPGLPKEELDEIGRVFDTTKIVEKYNPYRADPAINLWNRELEIGEYLGIWLKYAVKYPYSYLLAWRDSTYGYWYPDIQYWVYSDEIRENDMGIYKDSVLDEETWIEMQEFENKYKRIPVYGLLWSIGFIVWLTFLSMGITVVRKGWKKCIIYMPLIGIWVTLLIASPVHAEFRYIYAFFLCLPLTLLLPFVASGNEHAIRKTETK